MSSPAQPTDDEIRKWIEEARSGSRQALDQLFTLYRQHLVLQVHYHFPQDSDPRKAPSDFVQDALLMAFQRFHTFHGQSRKELSRWLKVILHNIVVDYNRAQQAQKRCAGKEVSLDAHILTMCSSPERCPESVLIDQEKLAEVQIAINELPAEDRTLIRLHHMEKLSLPHVAIALGVSPEAVRKRLFRIKRSLGERLKKNMDDRD
jgi:RNA polymerase sigma-70 factor (ECF subfamily)